MTVDNTFFSKFQSTQNYVITSSYPSTNQKLGNDTYINPSNTNPATTQSLLVTTSVILKTSSSIKTTIKPKRYIILIFVQPSVIPNNLSSNDYFRHQSNHFLKQKICCLNVR